MALDEAANPQPRDRPRTGAGTAGALVGVGGGIAQGSTAAPPPPRSSGSAPRTSVSSGGGGGGSGVLAQMAATGLTPEEWAAIAAMGAGGGQTAAAPAQQDIPYPGDDFSNAQYAQAAQMTGNTPIAEQAGLISPEMAAFYAAIDQALSGQESDYRRQQDETQRRFDESIPMFNTSWDRNRTNVLNSYEGRGLLKSGGAEDAVARTYEQQGDDLARQRQGVADTIAGLERSIAQARANAAVQKAGYLPGQVSSTQAT